MNTHMQKHAHVRIGTSPVYLQRSLEHYSLVIEILFPRHSVDGCWDQREALDRKETDSVWADWTETLPCQCGYLGCFAGFNVL